MHPNDVASTTIPKEEVCHRAAATPKQRKHRSSAAPGSSPPPFTAAPQLPAPPLPPPPPPLPSSPPSTPPPPSPSSPPSPSAPAPPALLPSPTTVTTAAALVTTAAAASIAASAAPAASVTPAAIVVVSTATAARLCRPSCHWELLRPARAVAVTCAARLVWGGPHVASEPRPRVARGEPPLQLEPCACAQAQSSRNMQHAYLF